MNSPQAGVAREDERAWERGDSCPLPSLFHVLLLGNYGEFGIREPFSQAYDLMQRQVFIK